MNAAMLGIGAALGMMKEAVGLASSVKGHELTGKLLELQGKLADVQVALSDQAMENMDLICKLRDAQEALRVAQERLRDKGDRRQYDSVLWIRDNPNPICAVCAGNLDKDIPLVRNCEYQNCRICNTSYLRPQPPPDFGIENLHYPVDPPPSPPVRTRWDRDRY